MSDAGEESEGGRRAHLSESSSPPLSVGLPRESPSSRPLDLFSSASPLLGESDPPFLSSSECLHTSPGGRDLGGSTHFTPPKFRQPDLDTECISRSRPDLRTDVEYEEHDVQLPMWRGRGAESTERLQHRGQRLHRAPELPDLGNHFSAEHIDTEFSSDTRQS